MIHKVKNRESVSGTQQAFLIALKESVVNLNFEGVKKAADDAVKAGLPPIKAVTEGLAEGLKVVGEKFERGEYFLAELVVAAEVMKEGMSIIRPHIKGEDMKARGRVVLATVKGDYHDIGKSLVATLLRVSGFEVVDLGVDVPTERIIETVKKLDPQILGLSALLTVTMPEMGEVIKELKTSGVREGVKVIVGGSPVTKEFAEVIGADFRAADAVDGVKKCVEWVTERVSA